MTTERRSPELLPLKSDFVFKLVFGDSRHVDVLTAFLQSVIDLPAEDYEKVTIVDPHVKKESITDKAGVLDVKIHTKSGKVVHVEIQVEHEADLRNRISYYQSKMIHEQVGAGDDYDVIKKVISIVITDFKLINKSSPYCHTFLMYDPVRHVQFSDLQEIHTLELPKLPKESNMTELFDWMSLFKAKRTEDYEMLAQKNPAIGKAVAIIKQLSADEQTRAEYETHEKWRMDYAVTMRHAAHKGLKKGLNEGMKKGMEKGMKKGMEKGLEKGMEKGMEKGLEKGMKKGLEKGMEKGLDEGLKQGKNERSAEIARTMKAMGLANVVISKATGLTDAEIDKLQ